LVETVASERAAHVACTAEDLGRSLVYCRCVCKGLQAWPNYEKYLYVSSHVSLTRESPSERLSLTIHTICFAGFPGPGGSQLIGSWSFGFALLSGDMASRVPF
jgi:hypothetical protein